MLRYTPKKNKKGRLWALLAALFGAFLMFFSLSLAWRWGLFLQMLSLFLFVLSFEVLYRYELITYTYLADDRDFVILRRVGKKTRTVCGLSMADAVSLVKTPKKKRGLPKGAVRYNFTASMRAKAPYSILFEDGDRLFEIVFEPNEEMCAFLRARIGEKGAG